jgi:hypothetical protein
MCHDLIRYKTISFLALQQLSFFSLFVVQVDGDTGNVVGIAIRLWAGRLGVLISVGQRGPIQLVIKMGIGVK